MRLLHALLPALLLAGCLPTATDAHEARLTLERDGEVVTATLEAGTLPTLRPVLYFGGEDLASSETECRPEGNGLACAVGVPVAKSDKGRSCWDVRCKLPPNRTYTVNLSGLGISANATFYRPDGSLHVLRFP